MTVVTFALPDESRSFRPRLGASRRSLPGLPATAGRLGGAGGEEIIVVHAGVGDSPARRERLARFFGEEGRTASRVVISGFAGALRPGIAVGDLMLGENYTEAAFVAPVRRALTGEPLHVGPIRTEAAAVETAAAKAALHAGTGTLAVDMETAWIAALAADAGVPTLSLRVISDAADQDFPLPGGVMFDPVRQRPRYLALPGYLLTHPGRVGPFARFVRGLGPARARLATALEKVIRALVDGTNDR